MLRDVAHPNVTRLFDVFHDAPEEDGAITISLVFELMAADAASVSLGTTRSETPSFSTPPQSRDDALAQATDLERVIYERRDRVSLGALSNAASVQQVCRFERAE